jgi:aldose 1-epimerase
LETLRLENDRLVIEVAPLGARLQTVSFDGIGNLVFSAETEAEALGDKKYNGATVGPVANRIANGTASLDDRDCHFEKNENGQTTLHGGSSGLHAQRWDVVSHSETQLVLALALEDGVGGFPANRHLKAIFALDGDAFTVAYEATTDAPTWINLALHPYWSLAVGRDGLTLKVAADRYTPVDARKIPTGESAPVDGTIFDLRQPVAPSPEIDHNFVLSGEEPAVSLSSDRVRLDIETDAPGLQVFSGKDIGIAIEPQHFPDAMHHPSFPSIELRPGETYRQFSTYRFSML